MKTNPILLSLLFLAFTSIAASAQEPEFPQPSKQHEWLKQFEGEWVATAKSIDTPEMPAMDCNSTFKARMVGGFWMVSESKGEIAGSKMMSIQTIGYDRKKKKYIGTWVDNMMDHMWHYEGTVDESGKKLSLIAEGPNFMADGKLTKFRDSYEFKSPDHIISTSEILGEDGKWVTFMSGDSHRKK